MFGKTEKKDKVTENKEIQSTPKTQSNQLSNLDEMDKLFDQFLKNRWSHPFSWNFPDIKGFNTESEVRIPSVDIVEKDDNIVVRAEIPGIEKENIDVTLNGNCLTIKGKSKHESKEETEDFHRCEISTGSFIRSLTLPADVNGNKVKATFTNGLLEVTLPKVENSSRNTIKID